MNMTERESDEKGEREGTEGREEDLKQTDAGM